MAASTTNTRDLPAASGLAGQAEALPRPGEYPDADVQTQVPTIVGVCSAFMVLSTLIVSLRLYTRYGLTKAAGEDDITIIAAQIIGLGLGTTTILQSAYGLGRHTWMVSQSDRTRQLELLLASEIIYNAAQAMTKVSLLLQYRRIFRGPRTRLVCLLLILFVSAWCVISVVLDAVACTPVAILNPRLRDTCLESLLVWSLSSSVSIVTNFAVVAAPIPATWALQLHRRQRIVLTVLFGFGFCTGVVAIARVLTVRRAALSADASWDGSAVSHLSVVEVHVGVVCACLLTLRPLLARLLPGALGPPAAGPPGKHPVPRAGGPGSAGRRSLRDPHGSCAVVGTGTGTTTTTTKHADHGIYGLADLEATRALSASQEGLTGAGAGATAGYHPELPAAAAAAHLRRLLAGGARLSTSVAAGGCGGPAAGDIIVVTRETTVREETRGAVGPRPEGAGGGGVAGTATRGRRTIGVGSCHGLVQGHGRGPVDGVASATQL